MVQIVATGRAVLTFSCPYWDILLVWAMYGAFLTLPTAMEEVCLFSTQWCLILGGSQILMSVCKVKIMFGKNYNWQ